MHIKTHLDIVLYLSSLPTEDELVIAETPAGSVISFNKPNFEFLNILEYTSLYFSYVNLHNFLNI